MVSMRILCSQREFFEFVPNILREGGEFSFFNGLAGTNPFFHDVYCQLVELEVCELSVYDLE